MATFVLVHGTYSGGWIWQATARIMRLKGHEVYTPTLTGLGEREHLATAQIGLTTHIMDVTNVLIYENLKNVILVGHDYGGMVITGAASRVPDRLAHLVYMDAYLPEAGQSVGELLGAQMAHDAMAAALSYDGYRLPPPPNNSRWTPMPLKPYQDPLLIEKGRINLQLRRTFIYYTGDKTYPEPALGPVIRAAERVRQNHSWGYSELPMGHFAMLEDAARVAQRLLELA